MFHAFRKPIAWFLIAALAMISGLGEGLHYIPGCGHGTPVGERLFLLGVGAPIAQLPPDCRLHMERADGPEIPVYDEDQCAICSVIGQKTTTTDSVQFILVVPLVHDLPAASIPAAPTAPIRCFQARAPPLV